MLIYSRAVSPVPAPVSRVFVIIVTRRARAVTGVASSGTVTIISFSPAKGMETVTAGISDPVTWMAFAGPSVAGLLVFAVAVRAVLSRNGHRLPAVGL
jgi:hypothetical protein